MESFSESLSKHKALFVPYDETDKRERRFSGQYDLRRERRLDATYKNRNLKNVENEWIDIEKFPAEEYSLEKLQEYLECLQDKNKKINLAGVFGIRKILSNPKSNPIQAVIDSGVITMISPYLFSDEFPQLQYETAWLLANICIGSAEQVEAVITKGCLAGLAHLLSSGIAEVKEQALLALGNISSGSHKYRDLLLQTTIFQDLLSTIMSGSSPIKLVMQGCWTLSCICRTLPVPLQPVCAAMIPALTKGLLMHSLIKDFIEDVLHSILAITCTYNELVDSFLEKETLGTLIQFLHEKTGTAAFIAMKIIGNFIAGPDHQTTAVLKMGGLKALSCLLSNDEIKVRREAMWAVSNICAGNSMQIEALWKSGLVSRVVESITHEAYEVQKEIVWVLFNLASHDFMHLEELLRLGLFQGLMHLMSLNDTKITLISLRCIDLALEAVAPDPEVFSYFVRVMQEIGCVSFIENLQQHPNSKVYNKALQVLERFFESKSEYESLLDNIKELTPYHI